MKLFQSLYFSYIEEVEVEGWGTALAFFSSVPTRVRFSGPKKNKQAWRGDELVTPALEMKKLVDF